MSIEKGRLRWHCRRGLLELDVVFSRFLARDFERLTDTQYATLAELLESEDPDLWDMVTARAPCPPQWNELMGLLRQSV